MNESLLASKLNALSNIFGNKDTDQPETFGGIREEKKPLYQPETQHLMRLQEDRNPLPKINFEDDDEHIEEDVNGSSSSEHFQTITSDQKVRKDKGSTPVRKQMLAPPQNDIEASQSRPVTQKQRELQELAMLIQAATGSINNVVETSQMFKAPKGSAHRPAKESIAISQANRAPMA